MGLKTLLGAFGLLAFIVVLGKHGRPLRRHNHLRRNKVEKDKEKNATLPIFSFLDYQVSKWFLDLAIDFRLMVLNLNRTLAGVILEWLGWWNQNEHYNKKHALV